MIDRDETEGPVPFRAGTPVPRSAKYAGLHEGHYLPYQMMHLFGGEPFPRRRERSAGAVPSSAPLRAL